MLRFELSSVSNNQFYSKQGLLYSKFVKKPACFKKQEIQNFKKEKMLLYKNLIKCKLRF